MDKFGKVAVLMGGLSAEREVSLNSGKAVLNALVSQGVNAHGIDADRDTLLKLKQEQFDRVFIALHGRWGEDGTIQGGLDSIGIPYTGSGVMACAIAMDKSVTKRLWQSAGLPTANFVTATQESQLEGLVEKLGLPLYVKAVKEGSSVGVYKVNTELELKPAWLEAKKYDDDVLVESFNSGDELTVGILNGKALPVIRIKANADFYDFEAKYKSDDTEYLCPTGLSEELEREVQVLAEKAFKTIQCSGWGRVDVMLDSQGKPQLLEVNLVPGMTDHSLVPMAANAVGIGFKELVLSVLETAK